MINSNLYSTHDSYTGISAKDELFIADKVYRDTGIPLAKNPNKYGIDLISLDPDRLLAIEVEGCEPKSWKRTQPRPSHWKDATFVAKKLGRVHACLQRGIPCVYIKINHFMDSAYSVDGDSLWKRLSEPGGAVVRENDHTAFNDARFISFDWTDPRVHIGLDFRAYLWDMMTASRQRKTKARTRHFFLSREQAYEIYQTMPRQRVDLSIHESAPIGFLEPYRWAQMVNVTR